MSEFLKTKLHRFGTVDHHDSVLLLVFGALAVLMLPLQLFGESVSLLSGIAWAVALPAGFLVSWQILARLDASAGVTRKTTSKLRWLALMMIAASVLALTVYWAFGATVVLLGAAFLIAAAFEDDVFLTVVALAVVVAGLTTLYVTLTSADEPSLFFLALYPVLLLIAGYVALRRENSSLS